MTEPAPPGARIKEPFEEWAILELMGHRQLAGRIQEWEVAGHGFLRIDIYPFDAETAVATQFYNPKCVYGFHPVTEDVARWFAGHSFDGPVQRWQIAEKTSEKTSEDADDNQGPW